MDEALNARIFISSGQTKGTFEETFAEKLGNRLRQLDYEPYIAIYDQSLQSIGENIFKKLEEAEYFLFVDFKRDKLDGTQEFRGSLFSHQELAIASFLGKPVLAFQEEAVKKNDGMMASFQLNAKSFSEAERNSLVAIIVDAIDQSNWHPYWRAGIKIEFEKGADEIDEMSYALDDIIYRDNKDPHKQYEVGKKEAHWYHIKVHNSHREKTALDCVAYLESYKEVSAKEAKPLEPVELKWKGIRTTGVSIQPGTWRHLDAFYILKDSQDTVYFNINPFLIDWKGFIHAYTLKGPGDFELIIAVYSANFAPTKATFNLHIGSSIEEVRFTQKESQRKERYYEKKHI